MIDPLEIRTLLDYDAETGLFIWKPRAWDQSFTSRWSGKRAFVSVDTHGYLQGKIYCKTYLAHRVAWAVHHGEWPTSDLDHDDGDRQNNRISNLAPVTDVVNCRKRWVSKTNTSGVTGVGFDKKNGKWRASIGDACAKVHLGMFAALEDAAAARQLAEKDLGYRINHGRDAR